MKLSDTARQFAEVAFGLRVQGITEAFQQGLTRFEGMPRGGGRDRAIADHHIKRWGDIALAWVETFIEAHRKEKDCLDDTDIEEIVCEIDKALENGLRSLLEVNSRMLAPQLDYLNMRRTAILAASRQKLRLEMLDAQLKSTVETRQDATEHNSTDYDVLLPILNRACFAGDLFRLTEAATESNPLSLIMVDCDHFKQINDTFGHPVGDDVLKRCATLIKSTCEPKGFSYRYGGEEFSILLPNYGLEEAAALADRIRAEIEKADFRPCTGVTVSLGIATYPETTTDHAQLVKDADDALYQAKEAGRNQAVKSRPGSACRRNVRSGGSSPLRVELGSRRGLNHEDIFVARITNVGWARVDRYQLDVSFPKALLNPSSGWSIELPEAATSTHRFFRVTEINMGKALLPGDSAPAEIQFQRSAEHMKEKVIATVFLGSDPPHTVEKTLAELLTTEIR